MRSNRYRIEVLAGILVTLVLVLAVPVTLYLLRNATSYFLTARGEPANLVVDVSAPGAVVSGAWRNFAQGGEHAGGMLTGITEQVSELDADYIRLDHIYDYYGVVGRGESGLTFDWSKLDREIDAILASGARPFLALSYMPKALSRDGSSTSLPANFGEWQQIVTATIEHYSGRQNKGVQGMYYEVWNEPDLFGNFKTYGDKNYLELYKFSALGARAARDVYPFKLGGPATTSFYPEWARALMSFCIKNNLQLDFLSWHRYSHGVLDFEKSAEEASGIVSEFPEYQNIELIISEAGPSSENDPFYDNNIGAAHTLATVSALDQKVSKVFSFEIKDGKGPEKYWGRWGILTHEHFLPVSKKPRFEAFPFLNSMVGRYVEVSGQGTWVKAMARVVGDNIKLLVVNYDPENKHFETVPVKFTNLANGSFIYKRTDFLGESSEATVNIENGEHSSLELFAPNTSAILELEPMK